MTMNPYEKLAKVLDTIPNGFPAVEDGSHLRVLEWIFTPEEADLASQLKLTGETLDELSERFNRPKDELGELLETMHSKGQINTWYSKGAKAQKYGLLPFAVGIYEEQLGRMDEEFARRFEDYFSQGFGKITHTEPSVFKVVPVNQSLSTELEIHPYEKAELMLESAQSWGVRECICKEQQGLLGNPCSYPKTVCIVFTPAAENAFVDDDLTKAITKEEALKLLKDSEEAGLVHCSSNVMKGHNYICNCCTCCCGVLRGINEFDNPRDLIKTDFLIQVDADLCTGCGTCVDRCQLGALSIPEETSVVDEKRCIGCGVCAMVCPEGALELVRKESEKPLPENTLDWMTQRAISRDVDPSDIM